MNFELSEDQIAIQEMTQAFARDRLTPKALEWDQTAHFPVEIIRETGELGMGAIYVSEENGGSGLTRLDGALIFEALAAGCPTISSYISIHNMVVGIVDRACNGEQRQRWMGKLASFEWLTSYCLTEPGCGSDAAALQCQAEPAGEGYRLNGTKQFISGAGASDSYLVFARTGGSGPSGISAFLVPADTPGLSFGALEQKMGWNAQPTRAVIMQDAVVPASHLLGDEGQGFKFAMMGLDGGRVNIAACSVGAAQMTLDKSIQYMRERQAFGGPLAELQGLQFKIADMATDLEAARLMVYRAADFLDRKDPRASEYCAMAKRFATDTGSRVADQALQIHGGYGYLKDYGIEKIVRDLRVHQILEGTNEIMRVIIAQKLLGRGQ